VSIEAQDYDAAAPGGGERPLAHGNEPGEGLIH